MLDKLYELWGNETQVVITIKSVGLNCDLVTVIEGIHTTDNTIILEFENNSMSLDTTGTYTYNDYEMNVTYRDVTVTICWEV